MAIAPTFQRYLDQHVTYDVIAHEPTMSSMRTAQACHISGDCLAKGVVLRDATGYMLAVLPASHHIRMHDLHSQFGEDVDLASEREIDELFSDCVHGAVPPIGECYGLEVVAEASVFDPTDIYFEGGDHKTLVHMSQAQFSQLSDEARRAHFAAAFE